MTLALVGVVKSLKSVADSIWNCMTTDLSKLEAKEIYRLFTHTIIPRPIAWILTENSNGNYNLAPFSYFTALSSSPALMCVSIGKKQDGTPKDTLKNLHNNKLGVVHLPHVENAQSVMDSSKSLNYGESEIEATKLKTKKIDGWHLPVLNNCKIAYHCKLYESIQLGDADQTLVILEATHIYQNDTLEGSLSSDQLKPLARLGGKSFAALGESFDIVPSE